MGRRVTKTGKMNPCLIDAGRCDAAAELARSVEFVAAAVPAAGAARPVQQHYGIPVIAIATLDDLVGYLQDAPRHEESLRAIAAYRKQYGVSNHA